MTILFALVAFELSDDEKVVAFAAVSSSVMNPPRELEPLVVMATLWVSDAAVTSVDSLPLALKAQASSFHEPGVVPTVSVKS